MYRQTVKIYCDIILRPYCLAVLFSMLILASNNYEIKIVRDKEIFVLHSALQ